MDMLISKYSMDIYGYIYRYLYVIISKCFNSQMRAGDYLGEGEGASEVPGRGRGRGGCPLVGAGAVRLASTAERAASAGGTPPRELVRAGDRAGRRARPLVWAGAWREGPRQASACTRRCEGVAYLIGALKRNLKQSECFSIMVGLPVAAARACLDQDMHSV
jgi:hypothetical protein